MSKTTRTLTGYEQAIYAWLAACNTDVVVIAEDSDGPRPKTSYVTFKVLSYQDFGTVERLVNDATFGAGCAGHVIQRSIGTVSVQVFGKGAAGRMNNIKMSYGVPPIMEVINALNLSVRSSTDTINLSAIEGIRSMPRYSVSFEFGWGIAIDYAADVIETLTIEEI